MRHLLPTAALLVLCGAVSGQDRSTVVVPTAGSKPGVYWIEIHVMADGRAVARVLSNVVRLDGSPAPTPPPEPGPGPNPGPEPPTTPSTISLIAYDAKTDVQDDKKDMNAAKLSALYRQLAQQVGKFGPNAGNEPWFKLSDFTGEAIDAVLGNASPLWNPWKSRVGAGLTTMEVQGDLKTAEQMAKAYEDIADGVGRLENGTQAAIDPVWVELIMQIIRMLLEQWLGG